MALTSDNKMNASSRGPLSALWATVYFVGLACILLGERVLVAYETLATVVSGVGVAAIVFATAARLAQSSASTARAQIGRLLSFAQLSGVLGVLVYWALTLWLKDAFSAESSLPSVLTVLWLSLVSVGVVALSFGEWSLQGMRESAHVESSRVRFAVTSGAILALAAGYSSLLVYAAAKQEAKADFSYFKTSEPGEPTLKLVDQIGDKVKITAFFPEVNEVRKEVTSYLARLSARNPALQVQLVDRYLEPKLASELKVTRDGVVVLAREENKQQISVGVDLDKARATLRTLDEEVHSRLMKLLRDKKLAYLTTGHGELNDKAAKSSTAEGRSADLFKQVIEQGNLTVAELGLSDGLARQVPADADVLVILGPTTPFSPEEVAAVKRYADGGGKVFMALDADVQGERLVQPGGSTDKAWLAELALAVGATLVPTTLADEERYIERRHNPSDRIILPTNRFSSHASVTTLSRNPTRGVVVMGASYLKLAPVDDARVDVAVRSFGSAFADADGNFHRTDDEAKEEFALAVAVTKSLPGKAAKDDGNAEKAEDKAEPPPEMRAFVLADADVMSDLLLPRVPGNPLLAFDAIRWLVGEESLAGEIESEEDVRVDQSKQMNMAWFYSTVFGVPLIVLGVGVLVSRRGRKSQGTKANVVSATGAGVAKTDRAEGDSQ
jgi:hypothetical protein